MIKGVAIGVLLAVVVLAGGLYFYFATGMGPCAPALSQRAWEDRP
jgi:hypothetical protein